MKEKISRARPPNYQKYYATKVFGGLTSVGDIRLEISNEKLKQNDEWIYITECLVIYTPKAAKEAFEILKKALEEYEAEYGPISTEDLEDKTY